jgi:hypothetical protein
MFDHGPEVAQVAQEGLPFQIVRRDHGGLAEYRVGA